MNDWSLCRASRLEALVDALAARLRVERPADPIAPVRVLVASTAQLRWLRYELADRLEVCAHVELLLPRDLVAELERRSGIAAARAPDPWAGDALAWVVAEALLARRDDPAFAVVGAYLREEARPAGAEDEITGRVQALASEVARTIARCHELRPDLVRRWREGQPTPPAVDPWLEALWRTVSARLGPDDPVARVDRAVAALPSATPGAGDRLWVFGLASLAPLHVEALAALLRADQAALLLPCPSDAAWHALRSATRRPGAPLGPAEVAEALLELDVRGHPLRASLGRACRGLELALEGAGISARDGTAALDHPFHPTDPGPDASVLARLQADVVADRPPARPPGEDRALRRNDDSLSIHSCYGPRRQAEVLRDALLHLLEDHPALEPRDVLVLTPDLETYGPLVASAFSQGAWEREGGAWGPSGTPRVPVELAEVALRRVNPVADALLRVLDLVGGRQDVPTVLELLALEPVRARFGLEAQDLPQLEGWLRDAGVRWAADERARAAHGLPADPQNTWSWGLDRLALGVTRAEEGGALRRKGAPATGLRPTFDLVLPFDEVEGEGTVALGRFLDFWATLGACLDALDAARPPAAWGRDLRAVVASLTRTAGKLAWQTRQVVDELAEASAAAEGVGIARPLARQAIRAALASRFEAGRARSRAGAVTLAPLREGRAVPRRVVCLLGLDEGSFPRNPGLPAFDPSGREPRLTDPLAREADRGALLDAILAARDHLLILHTGRDERTNETRAPAVPVAELLDALDASFVAPDAGLSASAFLTREHPLQPFARRAFRPTRPRPGQGGPTPWCFDPRLLAGGVAMGGQRAAPGAFFPAVALPGAATTPVAPEPVVLEDLLRFWRHPVKALLTRRLGLYLAGDDDEAAPSDREPVELSGLERWKVRRSFLDAALAGRPVDTLALELLARGALPHGEPGKELPADAARLVEETFAYVAPLTGPLGGVRAADDPVRVDIALGDDRLVGQVPGTRGGVLLDVELAGQDDVKLLAPWLRLLACCASAPERAWRAVVVFATARKVSALGLDLGARTPGERRALATRLLRPLVVGYRAGLRQPLPHFRTTSAAYAWTLRRCRATPAQLAAGLRARHGDAERAGRALEAACGAWDGRRGRAGEGADPYLRRTYGDLCPVLGDEVDGRVNVAEPFATHALGVWRPIFDARRTDRVVAGWLAEVGP